MRILGIDPGFATVGYGIVDYCGNKFLSSDYGAIQTLAKTPFEERLLQLYDELTQVIEFYKPETIAFEELFFNTNIKTGIQVAHGRGVLLLAAAKKGLKCYEYTPLQVKQAVVGYGRAEKQQVMAMVKMLLNLEKIPRPDDAADALAVAICHAHSMRF
ncbi:MAG: crossover junction endodeoxyribonuclease RuvC [Clostridiales bacterium]|nr:MAG: crossover junction endodeoxyribonuclease RuvC [Clostridiales bacterium]